MTKLSLFCGGLLSLFLLGCASQSGINSKVQLHAPETYGAAGNFDVWPDAQWWRQYRSEALNALIDKAMQQNPNLAILAARMHKAEAQAGVADAANGPNADLSASIDRKLYSANYIYPAPLGGSVRGDNLLRLSVNYQLDFWGRNAAALRAALSESDAVRAENQSARLLLAVGICNQWFTLANSLENQRIQAELVRNATTRNTLTHRLFAEGLGQKSEVLAAESALATVRRDNEFWRGEIQKSRQALAALVGISVTEIQTLQPQLNILPNPELPGHAPINLVGRRADLAAALARVNAAIENVNEAKAAFYPNINLAAFIGLSSLTQSAWLQGNSKEGGVGPAISLPLFNSGRLRNQLHAKNADLEKAVASYNQTLDNAIHDLADQMTTWSSVRASSLQQEIALQHALAQQQLAKRRFEAGADSRFPLLTASDNYWNQQRRSVDLKTQALNLSAHLAGALGGGYQTATDSQTSVHPDEVSMNNMIAGVDGTNAVSTNVNRTADVTNTANATVVGAAKNLSGTPATY